MLDKEEQRALLDKKDSSPLDGDLPKSAEFPFRKKNFEQSKNAMKLCRVYCVIAVFILLLLFFSLVVAFYASNQSDDVLWTILRPESDKQNYKSFMLSNNMKVMLISDPDSEVSAASLSVWTGSYFEPPKLNGLAHFLEHMLFLGTRKYPSSDDFSQFIQLNYGTYNAETNDETTTYYFSLAHKGLEKSLDIFSRFFIDPLLSPEYVTREVQAVDSEYANYLTVFSRRVEHLLKLFANPAHPFSRFSIGNIETLKDSAAANGLDLSNELFSFFEKYYAGPLMTLVVKDNESLDQLENWVRTRFSLVKSLPKGEQRPTSRNFPDVFLKLGRILRMQNYDDYKIVSIYVPLPDIYTKYQEKSLEFVLKLIEYDGKGSLTSYLHKKGWIASFDVDIFISDESLTLVEFKFHLNEEGFAKITDILEAFFTHVKKVEDLPKANLSSLYDTTSRISVLNFRYKMRDEPINEVRRISLNMHAFPTHQILTGDCVFKNFNEAEVRKAAQLINIERSIIVVSSPTFTNSEYEQKLKKEKKAKAANSMTQLQYLAAKNKSSETPVDGKNNTYLRNEPNLDSDRYVLGGSHLSRKSFLLTKTVIDPDNRKFMDTNLKNFDERFLIAYSESDMSLGLKKKLTDVKGTDNSELFINETPNRFIPNITSLVRTCSLRDVFDKGEDPTTEKKENKPVANAEAAADKSNSSANKSFFLQDKVVANKPEGELKNESSTPSLFFQILMKLKNTQSTNDSTPLLERMNESGGLELKSIESDRPSLASDLANATFILTENTTNSNSSKNNATTTKNLAAGDAKAQNESLTNYTRRNSTQGAEKISESSLESECTQQDVLTDLSQDYPLLIIRNEKANIWYKLDRSFEVPKVAFYLTIESPLSFISPKEYLLTQMLSIHIREDLREDLADARNAGYSIYTESSLKGLEIFVEGFDQHFGVLIDIIINKIKKSEIKDDLFNYIKSSLEQDLFDNINQETNIKAKINLEKLLRKYYFSPQELSLAIGQLTLNELRAFKTKFFEKLFIKALIIGNILSESAFKIADKLIESLAFRSVENDEDLLLDQVLDIHDRSYAFRVINDNPYDENSAIINYYQLGPRNIENSTKLQFLTNLLDTETFNYLRTELQLGYVVYAGVMPLSGVDGFIIAVQGNTRSPSEIDNYIEQLVSLFEDELKNLKDDLFEQMRESMLILLREKDLNLISRADRYWKEIDNDFYKFDRKELKKQALLNLKKEELYSFYQYMMREVRGKLSIQIYSHETESLPNDILRKSGISNQEQILITGPQNLTNIERFPPQILMKQ